MAILLSLLSSVGAFVKSHALIVLIALAAVNLVAFIMYGLDKHYAKTNKWRTPEAHLILVAALYGAVGAFLGMKVFRHKTKHKRFTITVPLLLLLQIAFAIAVLVV